MTSMMLLVLLSSCLIVPVIWSSKFELTTSISSNIDNIDENIIVQDIGVVDPLTDPLDDFVLDNLSQVSVSIQDALDEEQGLSSMARIQFIYQDGHPEIFQEEHILTLSLAPDQMPSFEQFYATLVFMSYQKDQVLIVRNFDEDHRAEYILHFYQVIINLATELSTEKKAKDLFDKLESLQSKECLICREGSSAINYLTDSLKNQELADLLSVKCNEACQGADCIDCTTKWIIGVTNPNMRGTDLYIRPEKIKCLACQTSATERFTQETLEKLLDYAKMNPELVTGFDHMSNISAGQPGQGLPHAIHRRSRCLYQNLVLFIFVLTIILVALWPVTGKSWD